MTIAAQISRLDLAVERLERALLSLDRHTYCTAPGRWSPRDILAHLVGWNRHVVKGGKEILQGQLPFYDEDPGENYSKVNAELVRRYPSEDRQELLDELRTTAGELKEFIGSLDLHNWSRDHGVRHAGAVVTVEDTVDELIDDYAHHTDQIHQWANKPAQQ